MTPYRGARPHEHVRHLRGLTVLTVRIISTQEAGAQRVNARPSLACASAYACTRVLREPSRCPNAPFRSFATPLYDNHHRALDALLVVHIVDQLRAASRKLVTNALCRNKGDAVLTLARSLARPLSRSTHFVRTQAKDKDLASRSGLLEA